MKENEPQKNDLNITAGEDAIEYIDNMRRKLGRNLTRNEVIELSVKWALELVTKSAEGYKIIAVKPEDPYCTAKELDSLPLNHAFKDYQRKNGKINKIFSNLKKLSVNFSKKT